MAGRCSPSTGLRSLSKTHERVCLPRPSQLIKLVLSLLTVAAGVLLTAGAQGHTGGTNGFATITASGETMRFSITLPVAAVSPELSERMHLGQPGVTPDYQPLLDAVEQHLHISADGNGCVAAPGDLTPPADPTGNFLIIVYFVCASAASPTLHPGRPLRCAREGLSHPGKDRVARRCTAIRLPARRTRGPGKRRADSRTITRGGKFLPARNRAYPHRIRPPPVPARVAAAGWQRVVFAQDHHGLYYRPQHNPCPRCI